MFGERLKKLLAGNPELMTYLKQIGLEVDDLGVHSYRKGGATYVATGSTSCNRLAVFKRGGWVLGVKGMSHNYHCHSMNQKNGLTQLMFLNIYQTST